MNTGKTLFAQLMDFLPWTTFTRIVDRYGGDHRVRTLSCAEQYRSMAFAQLTYRESLRDIETCLSVHASKLYHMGFRQPVRRSTLADANERRDWRIHAALAQRLITQARTLYVDEELGLDLTNTVYALDSTTIALCLSVFPWAHFRTTKAAVKMHTLLDLRGNIPSFDPRGSHGLASCTARSWAPRYALAAEAGAIYSSWTRGYSTRPFIPRRVIGVRNLMPGLFFLFTSGFQWLAFLSLISPYLQSLGGYPVFLAGLVMVPQAAGNAVGSMLGGRLVGRVHPVKLMICGAMALAWANWQMSLLTPEIDQMIFYTAVFAHGLGIGLYFVPLTVITFSTLPREHRDVGTGLFSVARNFGSSVGVSLVVTYVVRESQANRNVLRDYVSPLNETLRHVNLPDLWNFTESVGAAALEFELKRQAAAVAYNDDFLWLGVASLALLPMLAFMRMPARGNV